MAATLMLTLDDEVAGLVAKIPVIPAGQPDADSVTAELKPLARMMLMVELAVDPTLTAAAVALRLKLAGPFTAVTVSVIVVLTGKLPLVPFTASE